MRRLISWAGFLYLHLVGKTSLIERTDHPCYYPVRRKKSPIIYAFWHNTQVFLAYAHRNENVHIIVSRSRDGNYIADVMRHLGLHAVRGSSSKGGDQAFRELMRWIEKGDQIGFTPDGPRGPLHSVQNGVIKAAQLSQKSIVPAHVVSRRRLEFNSWDKFTVPLPFSRIVVAHGAPIHIPPHMKEEKAQELVRAGLHQNCDTAKHLAHEIPSLLDGLTGWTIQKFYSMAFILLSPLWIPLAAVKYGLNRSLLGLAERWGMGPKIDLEDTGLWLHAASVGEWQALKPLYEELKKRFNGPCLVTTSTPEAKKIIHDSEPNLPVQLIPFDVGFLMKRWVGQIRPAAVLVAETELWPNMIEILYHKAIPLFIVNGRLTARSARRWHWVSSLATRIFRRITHVYARHNEDAVRYLSMGVPASHISIMGNLKLDSLTLSSAESKRKAREQFGIKSHQLIVVAGSTWRADELAVCHLLKQKREFNVKLILAPRHIQRLKEVETMLKQNDMSWNRWSDVKDGESWKHSVLLVDTLGDLKTLYRLGDVAFVGGSLELRGGQNPLEPAAARLALVMGPSMENFAHETQWLVQSGGAFQEQTEEKILNRLEELLKNQNKREKTAQNAFDVVRSKQGSSIQTCEALMDYLDDSGDA